MAEAARRQGFAVLEFLDRAHGVDAADEAADPFERLVIAELRCAPAAPRVDRNAELLPAVGVRRRDDGDFALGELARERVLLVDLRLGPASRAIELRHDDALIFEPDLVDAVLVAVETEQAPVGAQAAGADAVEHPLGRELRI